MLSELEIMDKWASVLAGYKTTGERIFEFAHAIEAEVRKQDTELIRQMLEALKTCIQAFDYLSEIESVAKAQDAAIARLENT